MKRGIITITDNVVYIPDVPIWMSQAEMADLFGVFSYYIRKAVKNIYKDSALSELETMRWSGFIQVTLIGLPAMALPKIRAERNFSLGAFCEMRYYKYFCCLGRIISIIKIQKTKNTFYTVDLRPNISKRKVSFENNYIEPLFITS